MRIAALGDVRGNLIAAFIANRMRSPDADTIREDRPDFSWQRWGDAPNSWDERDEVPAWQALRGDGASL